MKGVLAFHNVEKLHDDDESRSCGWILLGRGEAVHGLGLPIWVKSKSIRGYHQNATTRIPPVRFRIFPESFMGRPVAPLFENTLMLLLVKARLLLGTIALCSAFPWARNETEWRMGGGV